MSAVIDAPVSVKTRSLKGDRRRALVWSYVFLVIFAVMFLTPPIYMLITSLKSSAEISAITNPWWVYTPTLENYKALLTSETYLTFFLNSALVSVMAEAAPARPGGTAASTTSAARVIAMPTPRPIRTSAPASHA